MKREAEEDWGEEDGGEAERPEKAPVSRPGPQSVGGKGRSEHEGIICKVLGGELLGARHQREGINLNRRGGNAGLRV